LARGLKQDLADDKRRVPQKQGKLSHLDQVLTVILI